MLHNFRVILRYNPAEAMRSRSAISPTGCVAASLSCSPGRGTSVS